MEYIYIYIFFFHLPTATSPKFFIRFGSFSMFIECYCIKGLSSSTLCSFFLLFCVAIVISEPFFAGAYFRPDFAAIERIACSTHREPGTGYRTEKSLRLDIFGLKRNCNKRNSFLNHGIR